MIKSESGMQLIMLRVLTLISKLLRLRQNLGKVKVYIAFRDLA
jgi:hypothetical protein